MLKGSLASHLPLWRRSGYILTQLLHTPPAIIAVRHFARTVNSGGRPLKTAGATLQGYKAAHRAGRLRR